MEHQVAYSLYDYMRDFSGPVMYLVQNIILGITAYYALQAIRESRSNSNQQIANQETIARKRATLDLILNMSADVKYNEARSVVLKMRNEGINPAGLHERTTDVKLDEAERKLAAERFRACQYVLNRLALFASGIQNGVLDEETFKSYYYSTFVVYVEFLRGYVMEVRRRASDEIKGKHVSHETLYQELIWLLTEWKSKPLIKQGGGSV